MNITLVVSIDSNVYSGFKRPKIKNLPLGLAYIAAKLLQDGHKVSIIDPLVEELDFDTTIQKILDTNPHIVGTSATTPVIVNALEVLQAVKLKDRSIWTVIGGPHISATAFQTLSDNIDFLDFVTIGEGEHTISELVNKLESRNFDNIKGLGFVKTQNIVINECREPEKNLDIFPFPARNLFSVSKYINTIRFNQDETPHISLTSSRGCVGKCTFCGSNTTWGRFARFRSPQNIINEIIECNKLFNSEHFIFVDDTFTTNRNHLKSICTKITELPFKLQMFCSSRVDTIDREKLEYLKKAGCYCVTYGIESGDDDILQLMGKHTNVSMIKNAIKMTKEVGIQTHGSFIIGNYNDTRETIQKTIQLAIDLELDQVQFSILVPLPGTICYDLAKQENSFRCNPTDFKSFFWYYSVVANMTKDVMDSELIDLQKEAYFKWNQSKC